MIIRLILESTFSGSGDGVIRYWDVATGRMVTTLIHASEQIPSPAPICSLKVCDLMVASASFTNDVGVSRRRVLPGDMVRTVFILGQNRIMKSKIRMLTKLNLEPSLSNHPNLADWSGGCGSPQEHWRGPRIP
jgi:WD40 repeat protein